MELNKNQLEDETNWLQYGQEDLYEYHNLSMSLPIASSWIYWPTKEEPTRKFKYASFEINMSLNLAHWQRETYSILDWLGDLGGLYDALFIICRFLLTPISAYTI